MNTLQAWVIVGIPGVLTLAALYVGRSKVRAWVGYAVLAAVLLVFVLVAGDPVSAGAFGLLAVFLVANGRGTHVDDRYAEHHQHRERFTQDPSHA